MSLIDVNSSRYLTDNKMLIDVMAVFTNVHKNFITLSFKKVDLSHFRCLNIFLL